MRLSGKSADMNRMGPEGAVAIFAATKESDYDYFLVQESGYGFVVLLSNTELDGDTEVLAADETIESAWVSDDGGTIKTALTTKGTLRKA